LDLKLAQAKNTMIPEEKIIVLVGQHGIGNEIIRK
jgi:hypothetical protein